jgi:serine protease inhibitor
MHEAQADFGLKLLLVNSTNNRQSLFISPISISVALAMCYVGAKGKTAEEIANVVAGDKFNSKISRKFNF